jgi:hypothetical protein
VQSVEVRVDAALIEQLRAGYAQLSERERQGSALALEGSPLSLAEGAMPAGGRQVKGGVPIAKGRAKLNPILDLKAAKKHSRHGLRVGFFMGTSLYDRITPFWRSGQNDQRKLFPGKDLRFF